MREFAVPYGRGSITLPLNEELFSGFYTSRLADQTPQGDPSEIVKEALRTPVGTPRLIEMARGRREVVVITSDHTRPVPSRLTMPLLLREIRSGSPRAEITILIATGSHRATTGPELRSRFGPGIVERERIVVHDCRDEGLLTPLGTLPSGGELYLNRLAVDCDLLVAEGFIEPHFFAGYSGGAKSILPGVAGEQSVLANHCSEFIGDPRARTGRLEGNPLQEDMWYAAEGAGLDFILNVVLNGRQELVRAFAGHPRRAHRRGCEYVAERTGVRVEPVDIVVTSNGGYPLDQNLYQAVKGMTAGEAACREGGAIIMAAECEDGIGGEGFFGLMAESSSPEEVALEIASREGGETEPDQWQAQVLARILRRYTVILVSSLPRERVEDMHLVWAPDLSRALEIAQRAVGVRKPEVAVIPDGVGVVVGSSPFHP